MVNRAYNVYFQTSRCVKIIIKAFVTLNHSNRIPIIWTQRTWKKLINILINSVIDLIQWCRIQKTFYETLLTVMENERLIYKYFYLKIQTCGESMNLDRLWPSDVIYLSPFSRYYLRYQIQRHRPTYNCWQHEYNIRKLRCFWD